MANGIFKTRSDSEVHSIVDELAPIWVEKGTVGVLTALLSVLQQDKREKSRAFLQSFQDELEDYENTDNDEATRMRQSLISAFPTMSPAERTRCIEECFQAYAEEGEAGVQRVINAKKVH